MILFSAAVNLSPGDAVCLAQMSLFSTVGITVHKSHKHIFYPYGDNYANHSDDFF